MSYRFRKTKHTPMLNNFLRRLHFVLLKEVNCKPQLGSSACFSLKAGTGDVCFIYS